MRLESNRRWAFCSGDGGSNFERFEVGLTVGDGVDEERESTRRGVGADVSEFDSQFAATIDDARTERIDGHIDLKCGQIFAAQFKDERFRHGLVLLRCRVVFE